MAARNFKKKLILSSHHELEDVAVIILGGGEGKRLYPLTRARCKPAVTFAGRYTLIDIPISHALLSGFSKIYVIGQHLVGPLKRHLEKSYAHFLQELHLLTPKRPKESYKGTADAVRKNLDFFSKIKAKYFLILSGDHLYNINFQKMVHFALKKAAAMVIATQPVSEKNAKRMGLLKLARGGTELIDFHEKPQKKELLDHFYTDPFTLHAHGLRYSAGNNYLGSMGIYLFQKEALFSLLKEDRREDFGFHLINTQMKRGGVHAYLYDGYWEDIGTIDSYYRANLALTRAMKEREAVLNCYDERNLIMTQNYHLPGAKILGCYTENALLCEGSIIEADKITNAIIGVRSQIKKGVVVEDSILMGNSYYEHKIHPIRGQPLRPIIDEGCLITKSIIDENVMMGKNVKLINEHQLDHYDDPENRLFVRDGIIIIPSHTTLPDNFAF